MTKGEILDESKDCGGIAALIPAIVLKDSSLSMSARVLYGVITWKCNDNACCWATNNMLGKAMKLSGKRVSALISELETQGHIEVEILRNKETNQVVRRNIYPIMKSSRGILNPIPENEDTPSQYQGCPIPENEEEKYKKQNIEKKRKKEKKSPAESDMLFDRFWAAYPKKKGKQDAWQAWKKLKPDMELCRAMSMALKWQKQSEQWLNEGGKYIPYPAKWLRKRLWEDEPDELPAAYNEEGYDGI